MVLRDRGWVPQGHTAWGSADGKRPEQAAPGRQTADLGLPGARGGERSDCSTAQGFLPGSGNVLELDVVEAAPPCECTKCRWIVHVKIVHFNVHSMNFV